jgi:hypothetical protein
MTADMSGLGGRRVAAPYVTAWSDEPLTESPVVERRGIGIAYADEEVVDRDERGVLWCRVPWRPGVGRPLFGYVHPLRQRHAMRRLLCQVCSAPADRTDEGVLWLLQDHREDWPGWPEGMGVSEPPICRACVELSVRVCPALRHGGAAVRVRSFPLAGVQGQLYRALSGVPVPVGEETVEFGDPRIRWIRAAHLIRRLGGCTAWTPPGA